MFYLNKSMRKDKEKNMPKIQKEKAQPQIIIQIVKKHNLLTILLKMT